MRSRSGEYLSEIQWAQRRVVTPLQQCERVLRDIERPLTQQTSPETTRSSALHALVPFNLNYVFKLFFLLK